MKPTTTRETRPVLLLPWSLDASFRDVFAAGGFRVLWDPDRKALRAQVAETAPDLALDWQHGARHFPVRDLLRECGRNAALFLCLNARRAPPADFRELGYVGWLRVPFPLLPTLRLFRDVLPPGAKRAWVGEFLAEALADRAPAGAGGHGLFRVGQWA